MAKSHELGGLRAPARRGRVAIEGGTAAALAALIVSYFPTEWADPFQRQMIQTVFVGGAGAIVPVVMSTLRNRGRGGRLAGVAKLGLLALLASSLGGCAVMIGTAEPEQFNSPRGETVISHHVKGVALTFGNADIGRTVVGGEISEPFAGVLSGFFDTAARLVGGFFTGLGGIGAAITPPPPAALEVPPSAPEWPTAPAWPETPEFE